MVREWFKVYSPCGSFSITNFRDGIKISEKIPETIVEFVKESNKIEGQRNTLSSIKQQLEAFYYLMPVSPEELTHGDIRNVHLIISDGLLRDEYRGVYRRLPVWIGGSEGCNPALIHYEMDNLIRDIRMITSSEKDIWSIHHRFEIIHPYIDMNGRVGRLLLNWLLLKNDFPVNIIRYRNRFKYYDSIRRYEEATREKFSI